MRNSGSRHTKAYDAFLRALAPGERLMVRLRLRTKLMFLGAVIALPLIVLGTLTLRDLWTQIQVARLEVDGLRVIRPLLLVVAPLQEQRAHMLQHVGTAPPDAPAQEARHQAIANAVAQVDAAMQQKSMQALAATWAPLRTRLLAAAANKAPMAFSARTELIDAVERQARLAAEVSGLILDANPMAYQFINQLVNINPPLLETIAQATALGGATLATQGVSAAEIGQVRALALLAEEWHGVLNESLGALRRQGSEVPGSVEPANAAINTLHADLKARFLPDEVGGGQARFREVGEQALIRLHAVQRDLGVRLDLHFSSLQWTLWLALAGRMALLLGGLLVMSYLVAAFVVSFHRSLNRLHRGTAAIANGDLAVQLQMAGRDELADIGKIVEDMSARLSGLVAEIRNSASMVNLTGQQVSDGSAKLASRTDEQAGSLRDSVAAITDLAADVARNAESARALDELTVRLTGQAEGGHVAMQETMQAMEQLQHAAARVSAVVRVIDDVAFQTSMLSLNAAIEASRAGEAGLGFSVVANEVRQLARRCAESAEEIRVLIDDTSTRVQVSAEKLGAASASLDAVVSGVREVSGALRGISESSAQQSQGLQQVTATVGNLDEITRDNASLVEQSSTASHALVSRAERLREAVSTMRLRQGSADEALAMVERAVAHVQAVGREQAFSDFNNPEGEFVDRDLYVFGFDREGRYAVCGAKPTNVGQPYSVTPGLDATFMQAIWEAADQGGAWVKYQVINPITEAVTPKESWVVPLDEHTLLGCGVYRASSEPPGFKPRAAAWSRKSENMAAEVMT